MMTFPKQEFLSKQFMSVCTVALDGPNIDSVQLPLLEIRPIIPIGCRMFISKKNIDFLCIQTNINGTPQK
jgi:hypothetical protein